jgi:hypothetical protein
MSPSFRPDERVTDVRCDSSTVTVWLADGRTISTPLDWFPRLLAATESQRSNWQLCGGGFGIHWPEIDEDVNVDGLLRGAPAAQSGR